MSLDTGLQALKEQRYQEAIELLDTFSQSNPDPRATATVQAQMGLIQAYQKTGQNDKAIALCQQLSQHPSPQVREWVKKALSTLLTPTTSVNPSQLLKTAREALKAKNYPEAIQTLKQIPPEAPESGQAQIALVKAYKGDRQPEKALKLCQKLTNHPDPLIQDWARQTLPNLQPKNNNALV